MLFLIDEIFRGTNSKDRHIGAKVVIKNLGKERVMGLVSTSSNAIYLMKLIGIDMDYIKKNLMN